MAGVIKKFFDVSEVEKDVVGPTARKTHSTQKALELSVKDAAVSDFSVGIGPSFATPFALAMKASSFQVGLLSSLTGLVTPIAQLWGSHMMAHRSRKRIVLSFVFLQILCWLPIITLGILYWRGLLQQYLVWAFIGLFTLYSLFAGFLTPSWFSWMGDLVPEQDRGKYFGVRNKVGGAAGIIAALVGGFLLDYFETKGLALIGFSILFALAFTFRIFSFYFLSRQYAPRFRVKKSSFFSLGSFIRRFDNYGKYATYKMFFYFALMFASPFFAVYMLNELNFSYVTFTLVTMSSSIFYLIFTPLVGRFSDRFGNVKLLYLGNAMFVLSPLAWLLFDNAWLLILVPQLIAGLANAAFVLGGTNFTYDSVKAQHRGICVAYENLFIGVGTFLGSIVGGLLLKYGTSITALNLFFVMFVLAAVLRFAVGLAFLPFLHDERKTEKMPEFHVNLVHPFRTIHANIGWFKAITRKG